MAFSWSFDTEHYYYLKNQFSESLAGRKRIFEMRPLNFDEFLLFKGIDPAPLHVFSRQTFQLMYYQKWKSYYEDFIRWGGSPDVVLAESEDDKFYFLKNLINAYIELDIRLLSDFSASVNLLKLIRLLANRVGSRLDLTNISTLLQLNRNKVKDYISLLEYTYFIYSIEPFSKNIDRSIAKQPKVYFSDTGILQALAQLNSGQVFENAIAIQLVNLGRVQFFQKISGQEIDFVLNEKIVIEVKETPTAPELHRLKTRAASIGLEQSMLVGRLQPTSDFRDFYWGGGLVPGAEGADLDL